MEKDHVKNDNKVEEVTPQSDLSIEFSCMFCPKKRRALSLYAESIAAEGTFPNAELHAARFDAILASVHQDIQVPKSNVEDEAQFFIGKKVDAHRAEKLAEATAIMQQVFARMTDCVQASMHKVKKTAKRWSKELCIPAGELVPLAMVAEQILAENKKILAVSNTAFANAQLPLIFPFGEKKIVKSNGSVLLTITLSRPLEPARYEARGDLMKMDILYNPQTKTVESMERSAAE